jgi:seryl-tRNA synthetase
MLDIQFIRQNADQVRAAIKNKGFTLDLDALLAADRERRDATTALELKRARKNELSASIPKASKDERPPLVE